MHKIGCIAPHHRRWKWRAVACAGHAERAGNRAPERIARPAGARPPTGRRIRVRTRPSSFPIPAFARTGFAGLTAPNACSSFPRRRESSDFAVGFRRKLANRSRAHCVGPAIRSAPSMRNAGSRSSSTGSIVASTCPTSSRDSSTSRSERRPCRSGCSNCAWLEWERGEIHATLGGKMTRRQSPRSGGQRAAVLVRTGVRCESNRCRQDEATPSRTKTSAWLLT